MAPGGMLRPPGDRTNREAQHRVAPGGKVEPARRETYNRGSGRDWRLAVRARPPGGLGRFRLAALRLRQAIMLLLMVFVCVVLTQ